MNRRTIFTKTGKGLMETTGKTSELSRDLRNILKEIDGKVSVSRLLDRLDRYTVPKLLEVLGSLERDGYVREFVPQQDGPSPARVSSSQPPVSQPSAPGGEDDLDFTALAAASAPASSVPPQRNSQSDEIARQAAATRARVAAARAKSDEEAKARADAAAAKAGAMAEALARARHEGDDRARKANEEKAKDTGGDPARKEADEKLKRQAEERVRREVGEFTRKDSEERARREAEEKVRQAAEERFRHEAEERARRENELKAKRESEERKWKEAEERVRVAAETKARKEAEERMRRESEDRGRRDEDDRRRREEEDKIRQERDHAERVIHIEAEAKAKVDAEMRARRETEERLRREEEDRPRREAEERIRREQDERRRREEEEARQRQEVEERAHRKDVEIRSRRAAEERIRKEDEERRERVVLERSLREQEERARREAAEKTREQEEREHQEREVRARWEARQAELAGLEERRKLEEQRARDDENRAREEAEKLATAEANAEARARKEALAQEKAEEYARRKEEARERGVDIKELSLPAREAWAKRQRRGLARPFTAAAGMLLVAAVILVYVMPIDTAPYEKAGQAWLGVPVKIGSISMSLLPTPKLKFEKVAIGKEPATRIAAIRGSPDIGSLFGDKKVLKSIELEGVVLSREMLAVLISDRGRGESLGIERVAARGLKLGPPELDLPPLDLDATLTLDGALRSVTLTNSDRKILVTIHPKGDRAGIEISADTLPLPVGADLLVGNFSAKGTVTAIGLDLKDLDGRALEGTFKGSVRLRWQDGWTLDGDIAVRQMEVARIASPLIKTGTLEGKLVFGMRAPTPDKLFASTRLDGHFTIQKGSISNIDMTRVLQGSTTGGGTTLFPEMNGSLRADPSRIQVRQIRMVAGLLNATGDVEMDPDKKLSGRLQIELRAQTTQARASVSVSGTLQDPQFRRGI